MLTLFTILAIATTGYLLLDLLIACIVFYVIYMIISKFPVPPFIKTIVFLILLVIFLFWLLDVLGVTAV